MESSTIIQSPPSTSYTNNHNENTFIPIGYRFKPDDHMIFEHYLPRKILGYPVTFIGDIELYGDKSPNNLFGSSDDTDFYFFTKLKKRNKNHERVIRTAGGGTWRGQNQEQHDIEIGEELIPIGTKRAFTYHKSKQDSWVMHEYRIDNTYVNYVMHGSNTSVYSLTPDKLPNLNPDDIVFCHVSNKSKKDAQGKLKRALAQNNPLPCKKQKIAQNNCVDNVTQHNSTRVNDFVNNNVENDSLRELLMKNSDNFSSTEDELKEQLIMRRHGQVEESVHKFYKNVCDSEEPTHEGQNTLTSTSEEEDDEVEVDWLDIIASSNVQQQQQQQQEVNTQWTQERMDDDFMLMPVTEEEIDIVAECSMKDQELLAASMGHQPLSCAY